MALKSEFRAVSADLAALKSPEAFRSISEVAKILQVPQHVLRFWESKFSQLKPLKRRGGRRYYRLSDIELLCGVHKLLYTDRFTIQGVQKVFAQHGTRFVIEIGRNSLHFSTEDASNLEEKTRDGEALLSPKITQGWKLSSSSPLISQKENDDSPGVFNEESRKRVLQVLDELEEIGATMKSEFEME